MSSILLWPTSVGGEKHPPRAVSVLPIDRLSESQAGGILRCDSRGDGVLHDRPTDLKKSLPGFQSGGIRGIALDDEAGRPFSHLGQSAPSVLLFTTTDFNSDVTVSFADEDSHRVNGRLFASTQPGLGITPKFDVLRKPLVEVR